MKDTKLRIKIHVIWAKPYYDVWVQNCAGKKIPMDDEAHSNITQKSEAMGRAKALSVCLSAEILEE